MEERTEERRKLPRKYLMAYSSVYEASTGKLLGYLSDLNIGGLMLIGKEELEIESEMELHLDLPEMTNISATHLRVKARVVRCHPDIDPRLINIGFAFIDLPKEKEPLIKEMINTYEFRRETLTKP